MSEQPGARADQEICIRRATLDRLLIAEGLRKRKRLGENVVRKRRKRKAAEGSRLQIGGKLRLAQMRVPEKQEEGRASACPSSGNQS